MWSWVRCSWVVRDSTQFDVSGLSRPRILQRRLNVRNHRLFSQHRRMGSWHRGPDVEDSVCDLR